MSLTRLAWMTSRRSVRLGSRRHAHHPCHHPCHHAHHPCHHAHAPPRRSLPSCPSRTSVTRLCYCSHASWLCLSHVSVASLSCCVRSLLSRLQPLLARLLLPSPRYASCCKSLTSQSCSCSRSGSQPRCAHTSPRTSLTSAFVCVVCVGGAREAIP